MCVRVGGSKRIKKKKIRPRGVCQEAAACPFKGDRQCAWSREQLGSGATRTSPDFVTSISHLSWLGVGVLRWEVMNNHPILGPAWGGGRWDARERDEGLGGQAWL